VSATVAAVLVATGLRLVASHLTPPEALGEGGAYPDGAPPGFSGGFKEESCHACHFHQELNAAGGRVSIDGVPATFTPGERYTLTITLTRPGMKRAGFQLTARYKDTGTQAGVLAVGAAEAERLAVETQGSVQYAGQRKAGAVVSGDAARWLIEWTAPASGGAVVFNVSANAADGNESVDGDFVHTAMADAAPPP
jgi:hypothetical protein